MKTAVRTWLDFHGGNRRLPRRPAVWPGDGGMPQSWDVLNHPYIEMRVPSGSAAEGRLSAGPVPERGSAGNTALPAAPIAALKLDALRVNMARMA